LSFSRLNGGVALAEGKREPAGIERRLALLEAAFGRVVRDAAESRRALRCGADDVLDAFAALWSAERIARGVALSLPADPPRDRFGIAMAISA
ncbi:MAG TPA: DUF429 domain-containing protein, partial [Myxococcota bacterium]|nr:DUF429 domain-containing protein [Myxococcota bacterium]